MKNIFYLSTILLSFSVIISCHKEKVHVDNSDIKKYTGQWNFQINGDPETQFLGQIHKFNDSTLNVHFQPETAGSDNYYKQLTFSSTEEGQFTKLFIPQGNTGGWTKKEGSITLCSFTYVEESRNVHYVTGEESFETKTITGTKVE